MGIIKEEIVGTKIICEVKSSNFRKLEYDTEKKHLIIEFNNGIRYEYLDVQHQIFTQMRMSESQGKFFKTKIEKVYKFKKL
jgi:hypothetical protein